jgi:threonine dehydratase
MTPPESYQTDTPSGPSIQKIREASERIAPYVRRTPTILCGQIRDRGRLRDFLKLKLECFQVTGSFKPRGAIDKLLSLPDKQTVRGLITASGGNHGLSVAASRR